MNTQTFSAQKAPTRTFITDDIIIKDFDFQNIERYEFTSKLKSGEASAEVYDYIGDDFETWVNENLSYEELYEIPMMNALYYYPSYVTFQEEDRYKVAATTTLLFDVEQDAWAVGMTGGGMDLAPNLSDTFIQLDKGVPLNIAKAISKRYNGYIDSYVHRNNCKLIFNAFLQRAKQCEEYAYKLG